MSEIKNRVSEKYYNNRKTIFLVFLSVFAFGFFAHGFMFSNVAFSHDSLNEFNAAICGNDFRIQFGKFLVPIYRAITRGIIAIPWVIGILSLIYISFTVLLVVKMFNIKSKPLIVLISGIFTTNMAVTATATTFIHDLDCDMLALLLATLGAYLWCKYDKGYLLGIIPCMLSMGLYQSYISVAITLIIFYCILSLLNSADYKLVFKKGLKGAGMVLSSSIIYLIGVKIALAVTNLHIVSGRSSSLDFIANRSLKSILYGIFRTYAMVPYKLITTEFMCPKWLTILLCISLILIAGFMIIFTLSKLEVKARLLVIALIIAMPLGMNFIGVFVLGNTHDLMLYSIWLVYLFALLVIWQYCKNKVNLKEIKKDVVKGLAVVLVGLLLVTNIYTANSLHLKKKLEYDATMSYMTRVVYSVENFEDYVPGKTQVVFVGGPSELVNIPGLDKYENIVGIDTPYALWMSNSSRCNAYFKYVLLNPAVIADEQTFVEMNKNEIVKSMPVYPAEGSMQYIDDILVVKLGKEYRVK